MLDLAKMEDFSSDFWWTSLGMEKRGVYTLVTMTHLWCKIANNMFRGNVFFSMPAKW